MKDPHTRTVLGDLAAVAQLPGLEELGEVMAEFDPGSPKGGHLGVLFLLIARWVSGSAKSMTAELSDTAVWGTVCRAALEAGRQLSAQPPTYEQLRQMRRRMERARLYGEFLDAFCLRFTQVSVALAQSHGVLDPSAPFDLDKPRRGSWLLADGTTWRAASGVTVDEDGVVHGSRAGKQGRRGPGPRTVEQRRGKPDADLKPGVPVVEVTVRADGHRRRFSLAVAGIDAGDEIGAAETAVLRTIDTAGGGVHGVIYDRLARGATMQSWAARGVLPVAAMKAADGRERQTTLPYHVAAARHGHRSGGPKTQLKVKSLDPFVHPVGAGELCVTNLWTVDGALKAVPPADDPAWDSPSARLVSVRRVPMVNIPGRFDQYADYEFDCGHGVQSLSLQLTAERDGSSMFNTVLPIPEEDRRFALLDGWRNDVESTFGTHKRLSHVAGIATSFDPDHFVLDAMCAALLSNAIAHAVYRYDAGQAAT